MLSLVGTFWEALLAQAFVIGIGAGCLFVPSVTVISGYFSNKLPAAIGIAASGSSLGGIIYPIMFHKLLPQIGFPWTVRIMGFMALALLLIPCTLLRMRSKPAARHRIIDFSAFLELPYNLFILGGVLGFMGLLVPFFYISFFGIATGTVNENLGFYLLPMLNATSIFGHIAPNILANKVGPLNVFVPAVAVSGILALCLIPSTTEGSLLAVDLMWGFFSGTFVSLPPSVIVSLTPPQKRGTLGTRVGMGFCVIGLGMLAGPLIAGAILGSGKDLHFTSTWIFAGCMLFASTVLFVAARIAKAGLRLEKC
jgi:MFS family permease